MRWVRQLNHFGSEGPADSGGGPVVPSASNGRASPCNAATHAAAASIRRSSAHHGSWACGSIGTSSPTWWPWIDRMTPCSRLIAYTFLAGIGGFVPDWPRREWRTRPATDAGGTVAGVAVVRVNPDLVAGRVAGPGGRTTRRRRGSRACWGWTGSPRLRPLIPHGPAAAELRAIAQGRRADQPRQTPVVEQVVGGSDRGVPGRVADRRRAHNRAHFPPGTLDVGR